MEYKDSSGKVISEIEEVEAVHTASVRNESPATAFTTVDRPPLKLSLSEERKLYRKIDWRLMPMLTLMQLFSFMDRGTQLCEGVIVKDLTHQYSEHWYGSGCFYIIIEA